MCGGGGGGAPLWPALLCALVRCVGGGGGRGRRGVGRRGGGADPVGRADGAVLDGFVLGAAGDRHVLTALLLLGD